MRISYSHLRKLSVETKTGKILGHVCDLVLDIDGYDIVQYEVKSYILSTKKYIIDRKQVISITTEKIIVDDAVIVQKGDPLHLSQGELGAEAVAMRDRVSG